MGDVIQFGKHRISRITEGKPLNEVSEATKGYIGGPHICLSCRNEWIGASPVGVTGLECPECGLNKGVAKGLVDLPEWSEYFFTCDCANDRFIIINSARTGPRLYCDHCGTVWDMPTE